MRFDTKTKLLNWIGYGLIAAGCVGTVLTARADPVTLTWVNPTNGETCVDAGAITIDGVNIWQRVAQLTPPTQSHVLTGYKPGSYTFASSAFNASGESRISNIVQKDVTAFIATAGSNVYQPVSITNGLWLLVVGTVTADIECIVDQTVNGKYAIPTTGVSWSTGVIPKPLVVADCA